MRSSSLWQLFSPANRVWYQSCGNPRRRKRPEGQTPPRSQIPVLRYPVLPLHHLQNHPSMADSPNLEIKLFTGQHNPGFFFFFTHSSLPPHQKYLPSCLSACEHVCVFAWLEASVWDDHPLQSKRRSDCKMEKPHWVMSGRSSRFSNKITAPAPQTHLSCSGPPRIYQTYHNHMLISTTRSRKCAIYQMSHHSNTLNVNVCVQQFVCLWDLHSQCSLLLHLMSLGRFFFFFSLCQCPLHARPNLATCYGWLIIFDGGLPSEWSGSTLDW